VHALTGEIWVNIVCADWWMMIGCIGLEEMAGRLCWHGMWVLGSDEMALVGNYMMVMALASGFLTVVYGRALGILVHVGVASLRVVQWVHRVACMTGWY